MKTTNSTSQKIHLAALSLAVLCSATSAFGKICPGKTCNVSSSVDCSTYSEIKIVDATHGSAVWQTSLIGSATDRNCGINGGCPIKPQADDDYAVSYAISESLTHSESGSMTTEVAAKVGVDAVSSLQLSHSQTLANGWQKSDTYTSTTTATVHFHVPPCKVDHVDIYGNWLDGSSGFSGSGYWHSWYFDDGTGSWENTDCLNTTSYASGFMKVYQNVTFENSRSNCESCNPCNQ